MEPPRHALISTLNRQSMYSMHPICSWCTLISILSIRSCLWEYCCMLCGQLSVSRCATPIQHHTHKRRRLQASTMARVDATSVPMHALDSVWLECGSSPRHHGIVLERQSAALGTALTTPHDDFWPRTTSSRLHKPHKFHVCPRLRCVALQNAGIRESHRDSHIDSPSKLRRIR